MLKLCFCSLALIFAQSLAFMEPQQVNIPKEEKDKFNAEKVKCLVCKAVVDEFNYEIAKVDPDKKVEKIGSFRIKADGNTDSKVVNYARSESHLNDLLDKVCEQFEDYAQAKDKKTGEPNVIRIVTREGQMNPEFGRMEAFPDEDLNVRLKFYCQSIIEMFEDDIIDIFSKPTRKAGRELCHNRAKICTETEVKDEL